MEPNVITALIPAFATGFSLQRLLELADPILERWMKERKRYYLALISLVFGFGAAGFAKLRILAPLIADRSNLPPDLLDLIVTALVISAGTEGFNSILKFLSYKKEEKKAESLQEKISTRKAILGESFETAGLKSFSMTTVMTDDPADLTLATPEDIMKDALRDRVRRLKKNPSLNLDFKNGVFSQHMNSDQDAQQVTVEATESAAPKFQRALNGKGRQIIRESITLGTKYGDAIGVMEEALTEGADPVVVV